MPIRTFLRIILIGMILLPAPVRAYDVPPSATVAGIVGHPQSLSLDCESRSAADWAAFWGVSVDETTFFQQLPKSDNPETGFVGDVNDVPGNLPPRGYGVHAGPVATLLREAYGLPATARRNLSEFELQSEIASGRPVIAWFLYGFRASAPYDLRSADGTAFRAAPFEHTGIVLGYDPASYTILDAFTGFAQRVDRARFLNSWAVLGNMAVTGSGSNLIPLVNIASVSAESFPGAVYLVQPGDTLMEIGRRFGIRWTDLAAWNNLYAPYTIFPGQQLLLSETDSPVAEPLIPVAYDASVVVPSPYTVQAGDTLARIAGRYGLSWPEIAAANGISWPYTIYPGQVLALPTR